MKIFEIKVTKVSAPERQFRLFASNAAALRWIMEDDAGNPGNGAGPLPWWYDRKTIAAATQVR